MFSAFAASAVGDSDHKVHHTRRLAPRKLFKKSGLMSNLWCLWDILLRISGSCVSKSDKFPIIQEVPRKSGYVQI